MVTPFSLCAMRFTQQPPQIRFLRDFGKLIEHLDQGFDLSRTRFREAVALTVRADVDLIRLGFVNPVDQLRKIKIHDRLDRDHGWKPLVFYFPERADPLADRRRLSHLRVSPVGFDGGGDGGVFWENKIM